MAAVAARHAATDSPHLAAKSMTSSPRSNRNSLLASDKKDASGNETATESNIPTINRPEDIDSKAGIKDAVTTTAPSATINAPLAPPPKPNQTENHPDYFSGPHNSTILSKEPNPFENAFGNPADTPGKTQLPGVTSLTSPASLLPGNTPGWPGSLRSGPLSPAMLTGPTGTNDYFSGDHHFAGSFPTPNESSLRTGLTPGGGGSMFPQPSPNSQAIYNQLQSGGATPGTLDFHRTAMTARAHSHATNYNATSQPQSNPNIQPDLDSKSFHPPVPNANQDSHDPFGPHQTNDAANGLYMLAQAGGQRNSQSFSAPHQPAPPPATYQPTAQDKRTAKGSVGSVMSGSTDGGDGHVSDDVDTKPSIRNSRSKKNSTSKASTNGKRKPEDTPSKLPSHKKQRSSIGNMDMDEPDDEDMMDDDGIDPNNPDRKMTDEEKRKNFLERNRVAALKCRQRKKQWLANLQQKVEIFTTENDALAATVTQLREEIVGLKTLLLAHKDCPVSQAQGISGMAMQQIAGDSQHYANPYGMAMPQGGPGMSQQAQMQRR